MPDAARFTIPYPEHSHFVGREDDLQRLHAALQGQGPVGINPAALGNPTGVTGQGGIGKTQLAVAYAYRYRAAYPDGVYWINAAEDLRLGFAGLGQRFLGLDDATALKRRIYETLRTRYSEQELRELCMKLGVSHEEFARSLGLSALAREITEYFERRSQLARLEGAIRREHGDLAQPQAQDEQIVHAFDWLREHSRSLLILDNLADPAVLDEPLTRDCVPGRLPNRLLFTTRRRDLGRFQPVELKTLPPDAALRLLLRDPRRQPILDDSHPEHETARDICATFGYLPLALEIAAAHLAKHPAAPLAAYDNELRQRGALDVMTDRRVTVATRHEAGLAAALAAQWATLGEEAQMVLRVAGQLPEAAYVPAARLGLLAGVRDAGQSFFDVTLADALAELNDASLIEELAGDEARLHPLVRDFARDRTPLGEKAAFRAACVRRLLAAFGDIATLERQCDARGIDALLRDLLVARELLDGPGQEDTLRDLGVYLGVLRREAHTLRGWRRDDEPGFLAQQLQLRLFDSATPALFGDLAAHLRASGLAWQPRWSTRAESPALEMTLVGHAHEVNAVAVTPDGRRAVSGGRDGTVRAWNLDTGLNEWTLTGHASRVNAVAVTPDGRRAVSGGDDGPVRVWNLDTGLSEWTLTGHDGSEWGGVWAVAVTPDGQRAVSGGRDGTVRVWNLNTGQNERTLTGHSCRVWAVAVMPDGRRLASGGDDGSVRVWNLDTGQMLTGYVGKVTALAVTPDGRRAVSGDSDRAAVWVWNLDTDQSEWMLTGHAGRVNIVAVTPDGRRAVSVDSDHIVRVWNLDTGEEERTLAGHINRVTAVAVTSDGRRAVSGESDGTLYVWNLAADESKRMLTGHAGKVDIMAVTPDGRRAVFRETDDTVRVWNLDTGQAERTLAGYMGWIRAVAVTPDGRRAVLASSDRTLKVWNLDTGQVERTLAGHEGRVRAVAVTPDGQRAVSASGDGTLMVWDLATGQAEWALIGHKSWVGVVAVTSDGRRAISGAENGTVGVWNLETGQREWGLAGHMDVVAMAVTPDGRRAISGGRDGTVRVWNLDTDQSERLLAGHERSVVAVAVTPDGRRAISGAEDGTVCVWNLDTNQSERSLAGHMNTVTAVAVMPNGRRAVSGGADRTLRMWDLATGRELGRVVLDVGVNCVAVAPGQPPLVVAGDEAGNVYCLEWVE